MKHEEWTMPEHSAYFVHTNTAKPKLSVKLIKHADILSDTCKKIEQLTKNDTKSNINTIYLYDLDENCHRRETEIFGPNKTHKLKDNLPNLRNPRADLALKDTRDEACRIIDEKRTQILFTFEFYEAIRSNIKELILGAMLPKPFPSPNPEGANETQTRRFLLIKRPNGESFTEIIKKAKENTKYFIDYSVEAN